MDFTCVGCSTNIGLDLHRPDGSGPKRSWAILMSPWPVAEGKKGAQQSPKLNCPGYPAVGNTWEVHLFIKEANLAQDSGLSLELLANRRSQYAQSQGPA